MKTERTIERKNPTVFFNTENKKKNPLVAIIINSRHSKLTVQAFIPVIINMLSFSFHYVKSTCRRIKPLLTHYPCPK